ncbi:MAG: dephospho-CoA kinase [Cellvibrionales bacterium]|jgi:dephospho-CoA kinase|nr:dephospho-CoA kinase [Cellvibrionales bacterium]
MFVVGLTGGIGSGKSAAATIFAKLGVTLVNADSVARDIVEPGSEALKAIANRFGQTILLDNGHLDRAALRKKIFSDAESSNTAKQWLEDLTHPLIRQRIIEQLNKQKIESEADYRILESPLLMETDQHKLVDRLLLIDIPKSLQIERTMARDHNSKEQVDAIIAAQMSREDKKLLANDQIENTGTLADLEQQVLTLHAQYQQLANQTI